MRHAQRRKHMRRLSFIFAFLLLVSLAHARDERSIKNLSKALAALAPDVDPAEAELLSETAHTKARSLAKDYRVVLNPGQYREAEARLVWSLGAGPRRAVEGTQA
jgi:hypothetical protein